ncbi:MAG: hypothetical protein HYY21_00700 [Candidatus Tectomicrobia bacterium]|nr:hypothetical protein [Candidatus Tectomicrobia bacterium]
MTSPFDLELALAALERACRKLGVEVRYADFSAAEIRPASGRCRLLGRDLILVDAALGARERLCALAACMKDLDLEGVFLPPAVRDLVETA